MKRISSLLSALVAVFVVVQVFAADAKNIVMFWPNEDNAVVKLTFTPFQSVGSFGGTNTYVTQVTSQNVSQKAVRSAEFTAYFFDGSGARVCDGYIGLHDVAPQQQVKQNLQVSCVGTPVRLSLSTKKDIAVGEPGPRRVSLRVSSVPSGAAIKVDGEDAGTTPKTVQLTVGSHNIEFTKEGFAPGSIPVDIGPEDASGGSISFELGGLSQDTVILRDNTVVTGDVLSVTLKEVVVSVAGQQQKIDRNRVAKIILVERIMPTQPQSSKR